MLTPALRKLRQEDRQEFQARLSCGVRSCLKNKTLKIKIPKIQKREGGQKYGARIVTVGNWVNFAWTGKVAQVRKATAPKPYYLCSAPGPHDGKREQTPTSIPVLPHEYKIIKNSHKR